MKSYTMKVLFILITTLHACSNDDESTSPGEGSIEGRDATAAENSSEASERDLIKEERLELDPLRTKTVDELVKAVAGDFVSENADRSKLVTYFDRFSAEFDYFAFEHFRNPHTAISEGISSVTEHPPLAEGESCHGFYQLLSNIKLGWWTVTLEYIRTDLKIGFNSDFFTSPRIEINAPPFAAVSYTMSDEDPLTAEAFNHTTHHIGLVGERMLVVTETFSDHIDDSNDRRSRCATLIDFDAKQTRSSCSRAQFSLFSPHRQQRTDQLATETFVPGKYALEETTTTIKQQTRTYQTSIRQTTPSSADFSQDFRQYRLEGESFPEFTFAEGTLSYNISDSAEPTDCTVAAVSVER